MQLEQKQVNGLLTALAAKADKFVPAANNNVAALDASGNLADTGFQATDIALKTTSNTFNGYITANGFISAAQDAVVVQPFGVGVGSTGELRFLELAVGGTDYVGFKAPDSIATPVIWTLPAAEGAAGSALSTDGFGLLSWLSVPSGSGTNPFLAKWTGASSLGDSLVYDDGTHIGIGTVSPTEKVTIFDPVIPLSATVLKVSGATTEVSGGPVFIGVDFSHTPTADSSLSPVGFYINLNRTVDSSFIDTGEAVGILVALGADSQNGSTSLSGIGISLNGANSARDMTGISSQVSYAAGSVTGGSFYGLSSTLTIGCYDTPVETVGVKSVVNVGGPHDLVIGGDYYFEVTGNPPITDIRGLQTRLRVISAVDTYYGLYLDAPAVLGTLTTEWGVFQASSAAKNFFGGFVGIGSIVPEGSESFNVAGTAIIDSGLMIGVTSFSGSEIFRVGADAVIDTRLALGITSFFGAEVLHAFGDTRTYGQALAGSMKVSLGSDIFYEATDGSSASLSGAATGKLRYNNSTPGWEASIQGGSYTQLLSGTGTTNTVAKFTSSGVLANSGITENGTDLVYGGAFTVHKNNGSSTGNTAAGVDAFSGMSAASSPGNTAFGYQSLKALSGIFQQYNTAIGYLAMTGANSATATQSNTAVGAFAMSNTTTGTIIQCVAIGANAMLGGGTASAQSQSVAVGVSALQNFGGSGSGNTAIGASSLLHCTTGSNNTAVGISAGSGLTIGSGNTAIGLNSSFSNVSANNCILINANLPTGTADGTMIFGGVTASFFGVMVSATPAAHTISTTGGSGTNIAGAGLTVAAGRGTGTGAGGTLLLSTAPAGGTGSSLNTLVTRITINSQGNVTIASPTSGTALTVSDLTANRILISGASGAVTVPTALTNGQLLIGSTGAAPVGATLTAGDDIFITNGAGSISISSAQSATVTTADGVTTSIATIPITDNTAVIIDVFAVARRTDSADRAAYRRTALVYREAAGSATLEGAVDTPFSRDSDAIFDANIIVSGNNALIQVTGNAGKTVDWKIWYYVRSVA